MHCLTPDNEHGGRRDLSPEASTPSETANGEFFSGFEHVRLLVGQPEKNVPFSPSRAFPLWFFKRSCTTAELLENRLPFVVRTAVPPVWLSLCFAYAASNRKLVHNLKRQTSGSHGQVGRTADSIGNSTYANELSELQPFKSKSTYLLFITV